MIRRVIRAGRGRGAARRSARLEIPPRRAKSDSQSDSNSDWGVGSRVIESDSKVIQIVIGQSDSESLWKVNAPLQLTIINFNY